MLLSWSLRTFEKRDLARIKTVYPEAFTYRQEKNIPGIYGLQRYAEYQLTVEATDDDGEASPAGAGQGLHVTALMKRRELFQRRLTRVVLQHHKVRECLSS